MKLDFWDSFFFSLQRIGIYVEWVDVKGFLITPALRKSTHHSREATGKQFKEAVEIKPYFRRKPYQSCL